jgi:opacity protein-like surface antigen
MRSCLVLLSFLTFVPPAAAQSTYIGASLVGDMARYSKIDYEDDDDVSRIMMGDDSIDGEALGFNIKVGRAFTDRWGLEFEYARSGEFETNSAVILPVSLDVMPGARMPSLPGGVMPIVDLGVESERNHMSMSALAFVRHEIGSRFEMSYLGGVAFSRVETETNYNIDVSRFAIYPPIVRGFETIEYTVGPAVGAEAAVKFGESAAVTGGVRLHNLGGGRGGWLLRPNVGFRWTF